jgi:hypothetical protein
LQQQTMLWLLKVSTLLLQVQKSSYLLTVQKSALLQDNRIEELLSQGYYPKA